MNQHLKDELFDAIVAELRAEQAAEAAAERAPARRRPGLQPRAMLAAAAASAVVAGGIALARSAGTDDVRVEDGPASATAPAAADAPFEGGYVFGDPVGVTLRVPNRWAPVDTSDPGTVWFRLPGADPRLAPMSISPSAIEVAQVDLEMIGDRQIRMLQDASYPPGMDTSNATGPWFWTEADGSQWMAAGLLVDLRVALPHVAEVDGKMVPGPALVTAEAPPITVQRHRVRDDRFELAVDDDATSAYDVVDPGSGVTELVDVNGHPGVRWTSGGISWRIDDHTTLTVAGVPDIGAPTPSPDEMLAAARAVRPATVAEMRALPVWRGEKVERVVVILADDVVTQAKVVNGELPESAQGDYPEGAIVSGSVGIADLDDGAAGSQGFMTSATGIDRTWVTDGYALPIGADQVGHRIRISLHPADLTRPNEVSDPGTCEKTVTVPPEGEPPVVVHLDAVC